jgi:hypothetical protein
MLKKGNEVAKGRKFSHVGFRFLGFFAFCSRNPLITREILNGFGSEQYFSFREPGWFRVPQFKREDFSLLAFLGMLGRVKMFLCLFLTNYALKMYRSENSAIESYRFLANFFQIQISLGKFFMVMRNQNLVCLICKKN